MSDTNPKLAFHLSSSFRQTAIPEVVFFSYIKTEGIDPTESIAKLQPKLNLKCRDSLNHSCRMKSPISQSQVFRNWTYLLIDACGFFKDM